MVHYEFALIGYQMCFETAITEISPPVHRKEKGYCSRRYAYKMGPVVATLTKVNEWINTAFLAAPIRMFIHHSNFAMWCAIRHFVQHHICNRTKVEYATNQPKFPNPSGIDK